MHDFAIHPAKVGMRLSLSWGRHPETRDSNPAFPDDAAKKIVHLSKNYQLMQPKDQFLTEFLANEHIKQATRMFGL